MSSNKAAKDIRWKWAMFLVLLMAPALAGAADKKKNEPPPPPPKQQPQVQQRQQAQPQQRQQPQVQQRQQPQYQQQRQQVSPQQQRQPLPHPQQVQPPQVQRPGQPTQVQRPGQPTQVQRPGQPTQVQRPGQPTQVQRPGQPTQAQQPRTLTSTESEQNIQQLNRSRAAMTGINSRPLPQGQVTVHPDGRRSIATNDGGQISVRPNGSVERMELRNGTKATFRPDGRVASIHAGGTHIERGFHGERQIVTQRGTYRVVSMGRNRGYLERPYFNRNGRTYIQRTYVVHGVAYTRVYRSYAYGGVTYYRYTPVVYYRPAFYGWAYNPWPAPVYYSWGWAGDPWYGYYGPYFAPYPVYPTASLWLTDFLLAENLKAAYEARAQANAAQAQGENYAPAQGQGENYAPSSQPAEASQNAVQMTPEVKQMIAEEVQRQLAAQQAVASPSQAAPSGAAGEVPDALDPADRTFVVSRSLAVTAVDGQECGLTPGDVLMRLTESPDANQNVNASVQASMGSDCPSGKTVAIGVQDLQEMRNHFREQLDTGLKTLASNSGKGGLPQAPETSTTAGEVPPAAPDANVQALLAAQQKDADQAEAQFQQGAGQGTQNNQ